MTPHIAAAAAAVTTRTHDGDGSAHHALLRLGRYLDNVGYRHTAVSAASHQLVVRRPAAAAATLNDIFGLSRRFSAEHVDARVWDAMNEAGIVRRDGAGWRSKLRVASAAPLPSAATPARPLLFFHSAYPTLDEHAVFFDPDTYRFMGALRRALRPALALNAHNVRRAIDVGCGAAAGAVLIARQWPQAEVLAVDLNEAAVTLAAVNAALAGAHRVGVVHGDALAAVDGHFDLIVAHPPYLLDPLGRLLRHGGGVHGEQRAFDIVQQGCSRLAAGGRLLLYAGVAITGGCDPLLARLAPLLAGSRFEWHYEEIEPDVHGDELGEPLYAAADRIAAIWLEVRRPLS
ncbi:methyltransferase [Massilia sp. PWRC2]|uniref:methyltransferase n=1 Tax=Massilia sp. PWRC2 TaxID=2804626 RepID=UPI003CEB4C1C